MGHFVPHEDQLVPPFVDADEEGSRLMAPIVGALQSEVAVMGTLTANIHLLMSSFYRPTKDRYKIILEGKAFPSDHVGISLSSFFFFFFVLSNKKKPCNPVRC